MILLDTSAIFALLDARDRAHERAVASFRRAVTARETFMLHNYLILETLALTQARLGRSAANEFLENTAGFRTVWITPDIHARVVEYYLANTGRKLSFVDCTSFVVMEQEGIDTAFTFDDDFKKAGFKIYK